MTTDTHRPPGSQIQDAIWSFYFQSLKTYLKSLVTLYHHGAEEDPNSALRKYKKRLFLAILRTSAFLDVDLTEERRDLISRVDEKGLREISHRYPEVSEVMKSKITLPVLPSHSLVKGWLKEDGA